jgi:hypothetical protein
MNQVKQQNFSVPSNMNQKELYYFSIAHNKSKHITEFTIAPHKAAVVILQLLLWSHYVL